ncbi:hypothetical protein QZH41_009063 [Actinostola sp. cb2023]|nr:hypothetical protein QZH41_009063 [Actinostola sp. cb2023]
MSASKSGRAITEMKARRLSAPARSKAVKRPEDIIRDVRGLKLRQRVSLVLNDKVLREELEDIVENFVHNGPKHSEGIRAYQDFLIPSYGGGGGGAVVTPISDIRGSDTLNYSKQERLLRCKLASVYRLVDIFGWTVGIYGHITARTEEEHFLLNPFGLLYSEVTASSLVKVDLQGNIIDGGSTSLGINKPGLVLHSAIHGARKDIKCVVHLHQPACVAVGISAFISITLLFILNVFKKVAATEFGLLPISLEASTLGEITYHDYQGILINDEEMQSIVRDLGNNSKVMILRNHGIVCCGDTIESAFDLAFFTVRACEYQVRAMAAGIDNLLKIGEEIRKQDTNIHESQVSNLSKQQWKCGELQFEAYMRMLDSRGYRTGYVYRNPEIFVGEKPKAREVTSPATTTSTRAQLFFTPDGDNQPKRSHSTGRANTYRNRVKWLNTPVKATEYKKDQESVLEDVEEPVIIKDQKPEKEHKDDIKVLVQNIQSFSYEWEIEDHIISHTTNIIVESSPLEEKGMTDAETPEGVVHKREVKETTVVVTRVIDKDGERKEETQITENKRVFIDGEEVNDADHLTAPEENEDKDDDEHEDEDREKKDEDGEGGASADSPEPDSPSKTKIKKKKSFKDALKKKFSKRGKDDHHEKTEKAE